MCVYVCLIVRVYACPLCGAQDTSVFARSLCETGLLTAESVDLSFSEGGGGEGRGLGGINRGLTHTCAMPGVTLQEYRQLIYEYRINGYLRMYIKHILTEQMHIHVDIPSIWNRKLNLRTYSCPRIFTN